MVSRQTVPGHVAEGQRLPGEEHIHGDDGAKPTRLSVSLIHSDVECLITQVKCECASAR